MVKTNFIDWGLIDYQQAWDKQEVLLKQKVDIKLVERNLLENIKTTIINDLIF
jgi:lipoyl(octanoyl) transferase